MKLKASPLKYLLIHVFILISFEDQHQYHQPLNLHHRHKGQLNWTIVHLEQVMDTTPSIQNQNQRDQLPEWDRV